MICNSGGALGSDQIFENECISKNIQVIAWSFAGHNTKSQNRKNLTKEELEEGWEHALIASKSLRRYIYNLSPYVKNLLSRNWFQVKNSDAIFAIGNIENNKFKNVSGGTGWAIQESIDNQKDTYLFYQHINSWYKYSYEDEKFLIIDYIPKLTENFAGIGTRDINENGINAIKQLLKQVK